MKKILITPRSLTREFHPHLKSLRQAGFELVFSNPGQQPDEKELINLLPNCVGYLAGVEPISASVLEQATDLRVISRNGTGINNIDIEACDRLNIRICRAEGANAQGVAELTIGFLFAMARSIAFSDRQLKNKKWERRKGFEIGGKVLGLIGCGYIGRKVAKTATLLGMTVQAYDPYPDLSFRPSSLFSFKTLDAVLKNSDIVSLHCPSLKNGEPVISRHRLSIIKPGSILINTARAELVDEEALLQAIEGGHIVGYATDVYRNEPPGDSKLIKHDNVLTSPHIGGYTDESVERATRLAVDNLMKHLK